MVAPACDCAPTSSAKKLTKFYLKRGYNLTKTQHAFSKTL
jgi:hypothetical protein